LLHLIIQKHTAMANKSELQTLLNQINNLNTTIPGAVNEYISLVKITNEKLQSLLKEDKSPMLDAWLTMGLEEIKKELEQRLRNDFDGMSPEKQKTEFMYSKSVVSMSLTNILMHL
jgi:phage portal protein BeeE